jgi:hypothetical protein
VGNNATVAASAYLAVTVPNGTVIAQTPDFNIPAHGTATQTVQISGYNPGLANLNTSYIMTVYSSQQTSINSSVIIRASVKPNCPAGSVYVNNSDCVAEGHSCNSGFGWNGTGCYSLCSSPAVWNTTSKTCYYAVPNVQPWYDNIWYVLGLIAAVLAVLGAFIFLSKGKRRGR